MFLPWLLGEHLKRRYDPKHSDTQHKDTQHKDTQHNDTEHIGIVCDTLHK